MTIQHLLTHTMAIGHKLLNIPGSTNENIPEYILGLPCAERIGTRVRYSSLGFILLGRILEKVYGKRLYVILLTDATISTVKKYGEK